ncbi:MAG: uracil-DNA glycosylase [Bacteroidales bacterium]|jgi:uracil-DNA glycosylase|nr:uracil-DNA glycosylase [Bacteroidales bacterium]
MQVRIEDSWKKVLKEEFSKPYFSSLVSFLKEEYSKKTIFPQGKNIFYAFDTCPFDKVKVVILGQDPYHEKGQAHGLAFSVEENIPIPPSLKNIYKEINSDLGFLNLKTGDLTPWAKQGVLLLNATLTVEAHKAGSHQNKGWETFTDSVVEVLSKKKENLVFILWGNYAQRKGRIIDREKHLILSSSHPSPLSAYNGFFGNHHFSQTNAFLEKHNQSPIVW